MKAKYYGYISMMCSMVFVYVCFTIGSALSVMLELEPATAGVIEMSNTLSSFGGAILPIVLGLVGLALILLFMAVGAGFKAYSN